MKLFLFELSAFFLLLPYFGQSTVFSKEKPLNDSAYVIVSKILVIGNTKTKEKVITRELLFHTGDTIYKERLDLYISKSKDNLFNTSLFNFITINTLEENDNYIQFIILVEERWYLWPYLILEQADRNLSSFLKEKDWTRINYGLMLVKYNFRGRRETVKIKV